MHGGDGCELSDAPRSGRPTRAGEVVNVSLQTLLILSPEWFGYYATHWTVPLLKNQLRQNTGEEYSPDTIRRRLHALGYVWKRPPYVLAPDPEREKKTQNSPRSVWFAPAERCVGLRRDGSAAVSTIAGDVVATRPSSTGDVKRMECPPRGIRMYESGDGPSFVPGSATSTCVRLPGVLTSNPPAVPRLAGNPAA
jgi:transposase